jgi:hypothetical protein
MERSQTDFAGIINPIITQSRTSPTRLNPMIFNTFIARMGLG